MYSRISLINSLKGIKILFLITIILMSFIKLIRGIAELCAVDQIN